MERADLLVWRREHASKRGLYEYKLYGQVIFITVTTSTPPTYSMKVTAVHGGDATLRQVTEGVTISNCIDNDMLINNKSEWMALLAAP